MCTETKVQLADIWLCILLHRECYERALEIYEKLHGHKHPSVATVLGNLGNFWERNGDKAKANSLYQEALAIQEEIHGPDHLKVSSHHASTYC